MKRPIRVLYSFPHRLGAQRICYTAWQQVNGLAAAGADVRVMAGSVERKVPPGVRVQPTLSLGRLKAAVPPLGRSPRIQTARPAGGAAPGREWPTKSTSCTPGRWARCIRWKWPAGSASRRLWSGPTPTRGSPTRPCVPSANASACRCRLGTNTPTTKMSFASRRPSTRRPSGCCVLPTSWCRLRRPRHLGRPARAASLWLRRDDVLPGARPRPRTTGPHRAVRRRLRGPQGTALRAGGMAALTGASRRNVLDRRRVSPRLPGGSGTQLAHPSVRVLGHRTDVASTDAEQRRARCCPASKKASGSSAPRRWAADAFPWFLRRALSYAGTWRTRSCTRSGTSSL